LWSVARIRTLPHVSRDGRRRRQSKVGRWIERVALGAVMGAVAFVVERRLLKVIRRRSRDETAGREPALGGPELTLAAEQVHNQASGQEAPNHPQDRR
jgi:hypothetical protein